MQTSPLRSDKRRSCTRFFGSDNLKLEPSGPGEDGAGLQPEQKIQLFSKREPRELTFCLTECAEFYDGEHTLTILQ